MTKKICADSHIDTAGAAKLKRTRWTGCPFGVIHRRMIRHSRSTVIAPAEDPNIRTDAKTKVSETERWAETEGILTVKDPVKSVRIARMSHCAPIGLE